MSVESLRPISQHCILLFARTVREEARVKRMSRALGLFELARRRVTAAAASLPGVDLLVVGPGGALPQRGTGFAERLANAFLDASALGYRSIVAVPIDVPRLGRRQLAEAFRRLEKQEVVLGPSPDGGVYLIGCRADSVRLFAGVRWQTPRAFVDLATNAAAPAVLDPLEDVDRWSDVLALGARPALDAVLAALVAALLGRSVFGGGEDSSPAPLPFLLIQAQRPPPMPPMPPGSRGLAL